MDTYKVSISEFFNGKNIFITGATGFIGKTVIEKLLRSCPGIGTIYILVRPKRNKELTDRLQQLINNTLYDRLKREQPNLKFKEKIKPLAGDMESLQLGLSQADRKIITDTVHIIYHVAASVRFNDPLKDAVILNVRGTREVCQLALDTQHLQALIHVSTAFANCNKSEAKEILYPPLADWRALIEIAENLKEHELDILSNKFIDTMPNTYCFTKQVAEHVVYDMCKGRIPSKIFRPSIVFGALRDDPVAGWTDSFNGPVGILVGYGIGILRILYTQPNCKPDYIPVDVTTKALIVCSWDLALRANKSESEIMQCTSYMTDWLRISPKKLGRMCMVAKDMYPFNNMLWYPSGAITNSKVEFYLRTVVYCLLPAFLVDVLLKISGRKPMLTRMIQKIFVAQLALRYFANNEWLYSNDNLLALLQRVLPEDKPNWDYDFAEYDAQKYILQSALGSRRHLLKQTDETLPLARRRCKRLYRLHILMKVLFCCLVMWIVFRLDIMQRGIQKISVQF